MLGIILNNPNIKIDNKRQKLHMSSKSETTFMVRDFSLIPHSDKAPVPSGVWLGVKFS